jgi:hypothetical protein
MGHSRAAALQRQAFMWEQEAYRLLERAHLARAEAERLQREAFPVNRCPVRRPSVRKPKGLDPELVKQIKEALNAL